jgi:hypothetical protein
MKFLKYLFILVSFYSFSQSVDGTYKTVTAGGIANTYTISDASFSGYVTNEKWIVDFGTTTLVNSGASTINRYGYGAKYIKNPDGTDVASGTLKGRVALSYNGVYYQVISGAGGTVSFNSFGSTPNSAGGSASGSAITLQPADGTNPGGVSTTTQTFAGAKTFAGSLTAAGNLNLGQNSSSVSGSNADLNSHPGTNIRLTNASLISLSSINSTGSVTGDQLWLHNDTGGSITIVNNGSVAVGSSKIITSFGANVSVPNEGSIILEFDSTDNAWRMVNNVGPASASTPGYLSSTDWNTFNNKQPTPIINVQSGTSYTLVLSDNWNTIEMTNAAASTVTVPLNSSVAFPTSPSATIQIAAYGAGGVTVVATGGVTIRSSSGVLTIPQYSFAVLIKRGTDEWYLENGSLITGAALTTSGDSYITVSTSGSPSTALLNAAGLSVSLTGTVPATLGGTGLSSYVLGDLPYASGTSSITALSGNITSTKKFLTQTGTGSVSAAPAWGTIASGDLPSIASGLTGILPIANGGTNNSTFTSGSALYFDGTKINQDNANYFYDGTNHRLGLGTTSPGNVLTVETDGLAVTQSATAGLQIKNGTAATAGVTIQMSPPIKFSGSTWNTTAVAAPNTLDTYIYAQGISGTSPSGYFGFAFSLNGAAIGEVARLANTGTFSISTLSNYNSGSTLESLIQGSPASGHRIRYASTQAGDASPLEIKTPTQYASGTHVFNGILIDPDYLNDTGGTNHFRAGIRHKPTVGTIIGKRGLFVDEDAGSVNGLSGVTSPTESLELGGNLKSNHIIGRTSVPTIAAGTGAGTSPTVSVSGNDLDGVINITTGSAPSGSNAIIATITFNTAYGVAPTVVLSPANRNSNSLVAGTSSVLVPANGQTNGVSTTAFVMESNTTSLTASTTYLFYYHVIQ